MDGNNQGVRLISQSLQSVIDALRHNDDSDTSLAHIAVEPSELQSKIEVTTVFTNLPPSDLQHLVDLEAALNHLAQPSTCQAHDFPLPGLNNVLGEQMVDDPLPGPSNAGMKGGGNSQHAPRVIQRNKWSNIDIRQLINFPSPEPVPDNVEFYKNIMGSAHEAVDRVLRMWGRGMWYSWN